MKFSYNWLQDFFEETLPDAEVVAEKLGLHSFELEELEKTDNDYLIDIDVLPNRSSDCLCYMGIAQEISTIFELPLKNYAPKQPAQTAGSIDGLLTTPISDAVIKNSDVHVVSAQIATDVTVAQSPEWLQTKLESIGQKSINNVVDITNYVMHVTGQPVHAFDYDKLSGQSPKQLGIRYAENGEELTDLTGAQHTLSESMMVLHDGTRALDVAGIKGGLDSGVSDETKTVVLSACVFDYLSVRQTSRALKLQTDASKRFENEVPVVKNNMAMDLFAQLLIDEAGAQVTDKIRYDDETQNNTGLEIQLTAQEINSVLGLDMTESEITAILERVYCQVQLEGSNFVVTTPPERLDLQIKQDIIEEVGRIYGYYNMQPKAISEGFNLPQTNTFIDVRNRTVDSLVQLGFYQANSRSITNNTQVELANPFNSDATTMRNNLLDSLQRRVERNFVHTETPCFFEIGKVFTGVVDGVVQEHWSFAGVLGRKKIKEKQKNDLFLQTKGVLETLFELLSVQGIKWKDGQGDTTAILEINGNILGSVGVNWWELNFEELVAAIDTTVSYVKPSKYPKMDRDVAVFVPMNAKIQDVRELIDSVGVEKCISIDLFDVFEDKENNRKSLGFRFVFQCYTETLSDEWTNGQMDKVYKKLSEQDGFEIR